MTAGAAKTPMVYGEKTLAVFRHEWRSLTGSRLTLVFQSALLVALSALIFLVADFYASDTASPALLATFLPWVALVFVPALAMSMLSEESGDRELELLSTFPMHRSSIVAGKWLARCAILAVTLALTFPFVLTMAYLGDPDWGRVAAVYFGGFLLLFSMLAIAAFSASMCRDQIGGFIAALAVLFVLNALGWQSTLRLVSDVHAMALFGGIEGLSPKYWFDRIASGRIEFAAVLYFIAVPVVALSGASAVLKLRTGARLSMSKVAGALAKAGAAVVVLGLAISGADRIDLAWDVTDEREYSLSDAAKRVVAKVPEGSVIDLYWSADVANVPMSIREHARRVKGLLEAMTAHSGGKLQLRTRSPEAESDEEFVAQTNGVMLVPMSSGESFMFGATVRSGERQARIPYFDLTRDALLEYDVALMLNGLGQSEVGRVGILSPLVLPRHAQEGVESLAVIEDVKRAYDVAIVPSFADDLPDGIDALVVINAPVLKKSMLCAIDRHVMAGNGLVVLMDPHVRSHAASNEVTPQPSGEVNDISDLLLRYGLRYEFDNVVGDENLGTPVADASSRQFQYPFWLTLGAAHLASSESVTAGLRTLLFAEPGHFTLTNEAAVPLLRTTERAGLLDRESFKGAAAEVQAGRFEPQKDGHPLVLGAMVHGRVPSAFGQSCDEDQGNVAGHKHFSKDSARVFAIADTDWIFDDFAFQAAGGPQRTLLNDNSTLFLNLVDVAAGDGDLVAIRSRGPTRRSFTRVAELVQAAGKTHSDRVRDMEARIAAVEGNIAKIPAAAGVEMLDDLPPQLKTRVEALQKDLLPLRRALRDLRREARQTAENLGRRLTLANLVAGPLLVLIQGALFAWWRSRRLNRR